MAIEKTTFEVATEIALANGYVEPCDIYAPALDRNFWVALGKGVGLSECNDPSVYCEQGNYHVCWFVLWRKYIMHLARGGDIDELF